MQRHDDRGVHGPLQPGRRENVAADRRRRSGRSARPRRTGRPACPAAGISSAWGIREPRGGDPADKHQRRGDHEQAEAPEDQRVGPIDDRFARRAAATGPALLRRTSPAAGRDGRGGSPCAQGQDSQQVDHPPREENRRRGQEDGQPHRPVDAEEFCFGRHRRCLLLFAALNGLASTRAARSSRSATTP